MKGIVALCSKLTRVYNTTDDGESKRSRRPDDSLNEAISKSTVLAHHAAPRILRRLSST